MLSDNLPRESGDQERSLALGIVALGTVLAIFMRLLPYVPGLSMFFSFWVVGALAIYGAAHFRSWVAVVPPLVAMLASDTILWLEKGYGPSWITYACLLIYVLIGLGIVGRSRSPWRIGGAAVLGALQFFLITNFVLWLAKSLDPAQMPEGAAWAWMTAPAGTPYPEVLRYARSPAGLAACYTLALPFGLRTLVADLSFVALFFGAHAYLSRLVLPRQRSAMPIGGPLEKGS